MPSLTPWQSYALLVLGVLIGLDVLVAYVRAAVGGTWDWSRVGQWVGAHVWPYLGGPGLLAYLADHLHPGPASLFRAGFWASAVVLALQYLLGHLLANLGAGRSPAPASGSKPS